MSSYFAPTVRGVFFLSLLTSFSFADSSVERMQEASCRDESGLFVKVNSTRDEGCQWIDINPADTIFRRKEQCNKKPVKDACPRSCGDCCGDNQFFRMNYEENGLTFSVDCDWIGRSAARIEKYCNSPDKSAAPIHLTCPHSCGKCPSTEGPSEPENPVAAPVDPPVAAPVEPPVDAPVEPPVAAPVEPPVVAPVDPPVEPPVAAPVEPPVAAPVEPPVAAPVEPPVDAPVDPPVDKGSPEIAGLNAADDGANNTPAEYIVLPIVAGALLIGLVLGAYVVHRKRQQKTVVELSETAQLDDTADEEMFRNLSVVPTEELNFPVKEETNYLPGLDCLCGPSGRTH